MDFCIGLGWFVLSVICAAIFGWIACFILLWNIIDEDE